MLKSLRESFSKFKKNRKFIGLISINSYGCGFVSAKDQDAYIRAKMDNIALKKKSQKTEITY